MSDAHKTTDWRRRLAPMKERLRRLADGLRALQELRDGPRHQRAFARYVATEKEIARNAK